jgi:DNA-binding transcriptional ArsR family regulator
MDAAADTRTPLPEGRDSCSRPASPPCCGRATEGSTGLATADELAALAPKADKVAELLSALAHSKRLMAMCRMMDEEVSVGALAESVGLGQSALSQHLSKLRALGLVTTRREGQTIYYRLASPEARELISTLYRLYCA